ncbi:MlaA family lipoprotein [Vibrio gallicus]|uniref:MlaA family lipoprotein n=1 Tax=Vibrio gallicus TaxID=190897 RepID=UPI0036F2DFA0
MKILWLLLASLLVGCASAPSDEYESHPNDPFEGFNRTMWDFNYEILDPYLVRPVSLGYVDYTPVFIRTGISNFLSHLDEPSSALNDLLMGNGQLALNHFNRFWINSTFGVLGLYDAASQGGIAKMDERTFSDVLGYYGVGNGWYFMIPAYGPWTLRQAGDFADDFYPPLSFLNIWASLGKWFFEGMEGRAALVSQEEQLANSPDSYSLSRDVFLQRRDYKAMVSDNEKVDEEEEDYLDDYLDDY